MVKQGEKIIDVKPSPPPKSGRGARGPHSGRRENTRSRVLAAAVECLHETGYAGASTLAVAQRAGVSRGALMKQFQSKATLFADLVEHLLDEMREETVSYVRKFPYGLPSIMARVDHVWELYTKPNEIAMVEIMSDRNS